MTDPTTFPYDNPLRCRCEYRPGAFCLNKATQEDGLCDPCRRDGGDGHPNACRWDGIDAEIIEAEVTQNRALDVVLRSGHADCLGGFSWSASDKVLRCACGADLGRIK